MSIYIYKFYYIVYIVQQTVTVKPSYSIDIWTNGVLHKQELNVWY